MPRNETKSKVVRIEYEDVYDHENMDKCPGFNLIERAVGKSRRFVELLVKCENLHAHRECRKIVTFEDGNRETQLVRCFDKLKTARELGV